MSISARSVWQVFRQEVLKSISSVAGQASFLSQGRFLVVVPHPDDETLGTGGLIAKQTSLGYEVKIIFLTSGGAAHQGCCSLSSNEISLRREALTLDALKGLGCDSQSAEFLHFPDGNLPLANDAGFSGAAVRLAHIFNDWKPSHIFCPHPFERWSDHVAAEELTRAAIGMLAPDARPRLYHYCVWFWYSMPLRRALHIDWRRARLLDISEQLPLKQQAMRIYLDALAPCGNPWVGKLPQEFLRAFEWDKELFFEVDEKKLHGTIK